MQLQKNSGNRPCPPHSCPPLQTSWTAHPPVCLHPHSPARTHHGPFPQGDFSFSGFHAIHKKWLISTNSQPDAVSF